MALNINGTTGISGVDGSATAPALKGVDSNTGVSFGTDIVNLVTGGTTRATVHSSGRVSIGTSSADASLHIKSPDGSNGRLILEQTLDAANYQNGIDFKNAGTQYAGIVAGKDGSNNSLGLVFHTGASFTERMRVTSAGNVEITNLCVAGAGFAQFDNAQHLISTSSTGSSSSTYYIGNAAIQTSSDRRIKENIVDTEIDASSELKKVRVVDFTWNDPNDKAINNRNSRGKWTGCIAQEIVDVFPFAVNAPRPEGEEIDHDSEALWGMEYGQLVPVLIKGFQELQAKIETLETEKAKMQTDLTALTARVTALEAA